MVQSSARAGSGCIAEGLQITTEDHGHGSTRPTRSAGMELVRTSQLWRKAPKQKSGFQFRVNQKPRQFLDGTTRDEALNSAARLATPRLQIRNISRDPR